MKSSENFVNILKKICQEDTRYKADAYYFVLAALNSTIEKLKRKGHVTGQELLEGIRAYGMQEYGRMARTVLEHWGVKKTEDFGHIVFNLVKEKLLGKTETDKLDDFINVYDFKQVFEDDYSY